MNKTENIVTLRKKAIALNEIKSDIANLFKDCPDINTSGPEQELKKGIDKLTSLMSVGVINFMIKALEYLNEEIKNINQSGINIMSQKINK
jgi:hypothetical protein